MGRIIRVTVDAAFSVSAIRHLLTYDAPTGQAFRVLAAGWYAPTSEDAQQLETIQALWTGTATGSTSGLDVTKADPADTAHGATIYSNTPDADLTIVADSIIHQWAGPINAGYEFRPTPEQLILHPTGTIWSMKITEAPTSAVNVKPWAVFELFLV